MYRSHRFFRTVFRSAVVPSVGNRCRHGLAMFAASAGAGVLALHEKRSLRCEAGVSQEWGAWQSWQDRAEPPPAPGEVLQLWASTDVSHCSSGASEVTVMASVKASISPEQSARRPPVDLVAVIDRSGSMSGTPFEMVQASLRHIVKELHPSDRLCIITFGSEMEIHLGIGYMTPDKHQLANDVIDSLAVNGATNISDGLITGLKQLQPGWQPGTSSVLDAGGEQDIPAVVLFTDGRPTHGIRDPDQIVTTVREWRNATGSEAPVHTFGLGSHCEQLLADLATVTDGMYFSIEDTDDIPLAFGQCVGGLLATAAQHMHIDFVPDPGVQMKLGTGSAYGWQFVLGLNDRPPSYRISLGDIYAGERRDALLTLLLQPGSGSTRLGTFAVTYHDTINDEWRQLTSEMAVKRADGSLPARDITVDEQRNRVETSHALKRCQQLCENNDFDGAQQVLRDCGTHLEASPSSEGPFAAGLAASLAGAALAAKSASAFSNGGRSYLASNARAHDRQRGCGMSGPGGYHSKGGLVGMGRAAGRAPEKHRQGVEKRLGEARPNHAASKHVPPAANAKVSQDYQKHAEAKRRTRTASAVAGTPKAAAPRVAMRPCGTRKLAQMPKPPSSSPAPKGFRKKR